MLPRRCLAIVLMLAACDGDAADGQRAVSAFEDFQQALHRGDRATVGELLTEESQPALDELPWAKLADQQLLAVDGAEHCGMEWWIAVRDPNDSGRSSRFVVVPERGRLRVDLLASMQHNSTVTVTPIAPRFEQRQLTAEEVARVQAMGYSAPR
jgi:hypothetical protein